MKVLVTDPVSKEGLKILEKSAEVEVATNKSEEELQEIIGDYHALVVRSSTQVTGELLEHAHNLQVVGRAGVGVDNIDVDKATEKGIIVINAPEGNTISAAEHSLAMLASLSRNIPEAHHSVKKKHWERKKFMGVELNRKTLGVLGLGRIGSEVARKARGLDMQILAYDPYISEERAKKLGAELVSKEELLRQADFISLHLPLVNSTYHIIGEEELQLVKPEARIVNCARGGLIDEEALARALAEGRIAGAALDVFEEEPLGDSPLLDLENVILTPHLGASTREAQVNVAIQVAEQVIKALQQEPVVSAVNVPSLSQEVLREIQPYLPLMRLLGNFYMQLFGGSIEEVEIHYRGEIAEKTTSPLTTSCLMGLLQFMLGEQVNYVNAPHLAKYRGIKVREVSSSTVESFANLITLTVRSKDEECTIAGTLLNRNDVRIVQIGDYRIEVVPSRYMVVSTYIDRPGVIGKVGTLLGDEDINIASMQVGRKSIGGEAVMVLQVDNPVPEKVLQKLKQVDGILDTKLVELEQKDLQSPV